MSAYIACTACVSPSIKIAIHALHFLVVHHQLFLVGDSQIEDVLAPAPAAVCIDEPRSSGLAPDLNIRFDAMSSRPSLLSLGGQC
jgi:hypothetical protein